MACYTSDVCFDDSIHSVSASTSAEERFHSSAICGGCRGCLPRFVHRHSSWHCCPLHECRRDSYRLSAKYDSVRDRAFENGGAKTAERPKSPLAGLSSRSRAGSSCPGFTAVAEEGGEPKILEMLKKWWRLRRRSEINVSQRRSDEGV
jgi:hypothetical protein